MRLTIVTSYFIIFCSFTILGQNISTIAGTGLAGYSGNGYLATNAKLNNPTYLACDLSGNIFISDELNNVIRKVNNVGVITTIAGTGTGGYSGDLGPASAAELSHPMGIALDDKGNIYFSDFANNVIRKINTSGIISTIAGTGIGGYFGDGISATNANLQGPYGIAIDNAGNIYFADVFNYYVRKINAVGIITTIAGTGISGYSGDGGPATSAQFKYLGGVATDPSGNVYITDYANHRVRVIKSDGIITTLAGNGLIGNTGDDSPATSAKLNGPNGVRVDAIGNVYISDNYANVVRKVNTAGIITTVAGNGTTGYSGDGGAATAAQFFNPNDIAINASGNILIADVFNNVIRKITYHPDDVYNMNSISSNTSIYPNPTNGTLTICVSEQIENVQLVNLFGVPVIKIMTNEYTTNFNKTEIQISLVDLPSGIYLVKVNGRYQGKIKKI